MTTITDSELVRFLDYLGITLPDHEILLPGEVAGLFRVDPRTVKRWAEEDHTLTKVPTPGGHGRYSLREVKQLLKISLRGEILKARAAGILGGAE